MKIKDIFEIYKDLKKTNQKEIKKFSHCTRKVILCQYFKKNKNSIIKSINFSFFESDENYLISLFSENNINFVHINGKKTKEYPKIFNNQQEYEVFLSIYSTVALLYGINFQLESVSDSRLNYEIRERIKNICFQIYYDDDFNFNLSNSFHENFDYLKFIFLYGKDFIFELMKGFYYKKISKADCLNILNISEKEFSNLYKWVYEQKLSKIIRKNKILNNLEKIIHG
ncbi:hypothetical protein CDJ58_07820 [Campylobacter lari]|nr:hypothetical protein [Campylobacter lari]EAK5749291.1 hypothetical protein [Campylobacter lari]EAK9878356.1 hypothetical protein [Campylobacter lari]